MADYQISARLTLKDQMTAQLKSAASAAEKLTRGIGDAKKSEIRLDVQGLEKLKRLQDMLRQGGMTTPKPINIRVNDNGATSKIQQIMSNVKSLASRPYNILVNIKTNGMAALNRAKSSISEMANGAAMGTGAGMLGVAGIGFGAVDMIDTYKTFEYQLKRNKALFTTGLDAATAEKQYQDLEAAARHYGSIMKFTAAEVGKAEEYMALAGWNAPTAIKALPAVLNAAVASGEDLALVSDIITDDMTAMGYKAGDIIQNAMGENVEAAQHFADVMLRTTLRSNTNFQQLGLAMKYAAPLAHTLGYNIEEVAVAMGLMANNGIKADQAGTGLRGILNRLINEPKKAATAMESLGVSLFDVNGKAKGLMPTLMEIRAALKGEDAEKMIAFAEQMTGEQVENRGEITEFLREARARGGGKLSQQDQAKLGSMLSGTYAMAAFMSIMNSSDEDIKTLMEEIYHKSDGSGESMAREMADTLEGDLNTIKSAWQDFSYELLRGDGAGGLRSFIQTLTADINQFKNAIKDGLDFSDIGKLGITVLDQLKDKFLQLDGIGSLLAGGALFMAMKKILSMGLQIKDTLSAWSKVRSANDLGNIIRNNQGAMGGQVGTMHVNAGVVNLTGPVKGGVPTQGGTRGGVVTTGGVNSRGGIVTPTPTSTATTATTATTARAGTTLATAGAATAGSILVSSRGGRNISTYDPIVRQQEVAARNSAYVNDYYARRGNIMSTLPPPTPAPTSATSTLRANVGGMAGAGLLAAVFGAIDIYSAKSHSEQTMQEARETVQWQKNMLAQMQEQRASQDAIAAQMREVQDAEAFVDRTRIMNANVERQAELGAAGAVTGAMAGAAIGSFVPVIGTALGGMIGGVLGQLAGTKLAEHENARQDALRQEKESSAIPSIPAGSIADFRQNDTAALAEFKNSTQYKNPEEYQAQQNQNAARETENVLTQNASAMARRQTLNKLESEGVDISAIPSYDAVKRHSLDFRGRTNENGEYEVTHIRTKDSSTLQFEQEKARGESLARQRDEYNQRWQQQFGGTSLAGQANFVPDNEKDREILRRYDEMQANKARQQNLIADIQQRNENRGIANQAVADQKSAMDKIAESTNAWNQQNKDTLSNLKQRGGSERTFGESTKNLAEKSVADQKSALDQLAQTTNAWNQQQQATLTEIQNQKKLAESAQNVSQESGGFLDWLDGLLFNKAAANAITPETNMEMSTPENSPVKPTQSEGLFGFEMPDFELPDFGAKISEMFSNFEMPELGIAEKLSAEFDSAVAGLETFGASIATSFSGLAAGVSGALSGVGTAITTVFSSAASEVQGVWNAMPGFFSGVFSGLGDVASTAGSSIYGGLTSVIGSIIDAWQSAASTISDIISSIGTMASSAASAAGNFFGGGVGSNATGTSSWKGGFTEINEHGGEIINLPRGTQIIPHATTVKILRSEIRDKIERGENSFHGLNFADYGMNNFTTNNIFGNDIKSTMPNKKSSRRVGQRQNSVSNSPIENIFSGIFGWTPRQASFSGIPDLGGLFGSSDKGGLSGDIITTLPNLPNKSHKIGQRQNSVSNSPIENIFTSIFGWTPSQASFSGLPDLGGLFGNDGGALSGDIDMTLPNFDDKFDIELPKIELPKVESSGSSSSSSSSSSSNTFNFGDIHISNGTDFDMFVYKLQTLISSSTTNYGLA